MMDPDQDDREFEVYLRSFSRVSRGRCPGKAGRWSPLARTGDCRGCVAAVLILTLLSMRHASSCLRL